MGLIVDRLKREGLLKLKNNNIKGEKPKSS